MNTPDRHSFVIRIWLEETIEETGAALWRGRVTHVPDGRQCYFENLGKIPAFIAPYLVEMGARPKQRGEIGQWFRRVFRAVRRTAQND